MTTHAGTAWQPARPERLSRQFSRLGWLGFWMQLAMLAIPVLLFRTATASAASETAEDLTPGQPAPKPA